MADPLAEHALAERSDAAVEQGKECAFGSSVVGVVEDLKVDKSLSCLLLGPLFSISAP